MSDANTFGSASASTSINDKSHILFLRKARLENVDGYCFADFPQFRDVNNLNGAKRTYAVNDCFLHFTIVDTIFDTGCLGQHFEKS